MTLYVFGRAVGGLFIAWGMGVLFVYFFPVFFRQPAVLIVFVWTWIALWGTFISRLLDWKKSSTLKKDGSAVVIVEIAFAVLSFIASLLFG